MPADIERGNRILNWRNALAGLPGRQFLDLMRIYLGEIKTPYNKQNLIQELSAFLRRPANRKAVVSLLSDNDLHILTAVIHLNNPEQKKLTSFFSGTFSFGNLQDRLQNLEERLLIYRSHSEGKTDTRFCINPLLEDCIRPLCPAERLLPLPEYAEKIDLPENGRQKLSSLFLAAAVCFISQNGDLRKADGSLKKRAAQLLSQHFPFYCTPQGTPNPTFWNCFLNGLLRLGLCRQKETGCFLIDREAWKYFAELDSTSRYAYLSASAEPYLPRQIIIRRGNLAVSVCSRIPESGLTEPVLRRLIFLAAEQDEDISPPAAQKAEGKFAALLRSRNTADIPSEEPRTEPPPPDDSLLASMTALGILTCSGKSVSGENIYRYTPPADETESSEDFLRIGAAYEATLLPGCKLGSLLEVTQFMELERFDTAALCAVTKNACIKAFDGGTTPGQIYNTLQRYSSHPLPQSLHFSIREWYESYSSASLYKGYILKISSENIVRVENNRDFASHIIEKLAPGVYLLDFLSDEEAAAACIQCGLNSVGAVRSIRPESSRLRFAPLKNPLPIHGTAGNAAQTEYVPMADPERREFLKTLETHVQKLKDISEEHKDALFERIHRKLVITPDLLRPGSVRIEKMRADAMDFLGKLRLIERAIETESIVEMEFDGTDGKTLAVKGVPVSTEKLDGDVRVFIQSETDSKSYSVGQAKSVRRIPGSIFKEA